MENMSRNEVQQAVPAWPKPVWCILSWVLLFLPAGIAQQFQKSLLKRYSLPGLQQQGIFRVPGSQVEVNDIKNSFERGVWLVCRYSRDPQWEVVCAGCISHGVKPFLL